MLMDEGLDTGPILSQRSAPLPFGITGSQLFKQLAELGARTLIEILPSYLQGMVAPLPQSDKDATYAPLLKKSDGLLDFNRTALELARQVNAYQPWPGTYFSFSGRQLLVLAAHPHDTFESVVGEHYIVNALPAVGTAQGLLVLDRLQPEGMRPMSGTDFLHGQPNWL
jgi:methionyl-tRNA formyltransferase